MIRWFFIALPCILAVPACSSTTRGVEGSDGCTAGAVRCQGDELQQCDAEGVAFEVKLKCVPGTCVDGQAACPEVNTSSGGSSMSSGGSAGVSGNAGVGGTSSGGVAGSGGVGGSSTSGGSSGDGGVGGDAGATTTSGGTGGEGGSSGDGGSSGAQTTTSGGTGGDGGSSGATTTTTSGGTGGEGGSSGDGGSSGATTTTSGGAGGEGGSSGSTSTTEGAPFCTPNPCPSDRRCDEDADECVCDGCVIGGSCVGAGQANASNSCEVCDPDRSTSAYSPDTGADCGSSETECSDQDTCNESAVCEPNDSADRTTCSDGYCEGGVCTVPVFDCIAPDPPVIDTDEIEAILVSGTPPTPTGGTLPSGRYMPFRVQFYGDQPTTTQIYSFEFDGIFAQAAYQPYPPWIPAIEFAGLFTRVGNTLEFDFERCDPQYDIDVPPLEYTATANGMLAFYTDPYGTRIVISYLRE